MTANNKTMQAAIVVEPGTVQVRQIPIPAPGPFEALVRIEACGLCGTTDRHLVAGTQCYHQADHYPAVLGHEAVGTVIEVGAKVSGFKLGDRVVRATSVWPGEKRGDLFSAWGGFAEYGIVRDRLALIDAQDRQQEDPNQVTLTTVHAAKGLEFDVVFVAGFEDGLFPHHRSIEEGQLEEERRLAYVAMTRARKRLILTYASRRAARTSALSRRRPSRFLYELPPTLLWDPVFKEPMVLPDLDQERVEAEAARKKAQKKPRTKTLLGLSPKGGGTPLWKRRLVKSRT